MPQAAPYPDNRLGPCDIVRRSVPQEAPGNSHGGQLRRIAGMDDLEGSKPAAAARRGALLARPRARCGAGGGRDRARRVRVSCRRLRQLPHRSPQPRRVPRRRAAHGDRVRDLPRAQHHARSGDRHRRLERGGLPPRDDRRQGAGRQPLLSGVPLPLVHRDERGGPRRPLGLSALGAAGREPRRAARAAVPAQPPGAAARLEARQLRPGRHGRRSGAERGVEPRRLPRQPSRPLRRLPYAEAVRRAVPAVQVPRRLDGHPRPLPGAQHHARPGNRARPLVGGRRGARARPRDHARGRADPRADGRVRRERLEPPRGEDLPRSRST